LLIVICKMNKIKDQHNITEFSAQNLTPLNGRMKFNKFLQTGTLLMIIFINLLRSKVFIV
jgi:hypothetical protein